MSAIIATMRKLPLQTAIFAAGVAFFSYSLATFGGYYAAFPRALREFLDGDAWWKFFFDLNIYFAISFVAARIVGPIAFFSLIKLRLRLYLRSRKLPRSWLYGQLRRATHFVAQRQLQAMAVLVMVFFSYGFLGFHLGLNFILTTNIYLFSIYLSSHFIATVSSSSIQVAPISFRSSGEAFQVVTFLLLTLPLVAINLGAHRLQYLSTEHALVETNTEGFCAAILAKTSSGIIVASEVRLLHPIWPYLITESRFIPFDTVRSVQSVEAQKCPKLQTGE